MWFVFPQIAGLGSSPTSQLYAIASSGEARAYLHHPLLGARLMECIAAVTPWAATRSAAQIFGAVDAVKFRSSLTLFDHASPDGPFAAALETFVEGQRDRRTLALLNAAG